MNLSHLIELKSPQEITTMKEGARLTLHVISQARDLIRVGMSTMDLDQIIGTLIQQTGAKPAFLNYQPKGARLPFPGNACICIDSETFHSPPGHNKLIKRGSLVTIDLGLLYKGFYSDSAETLLIGDSSSEKLRLIDTCREAVHAALPLCVPGGNINHLTRAIDSTIRSAGFFPVESYGGHGVGSELHMAPYVSNTATHLGDCELAEGQVLCLEPAATTQLCTMHTEGDGWTVSAPPGVLSSHHERMVVVTKNGGVILQ